MYAGRDFVVANVEDRNVYGFDFVHDLQSGDSVQRQSWSLTTREGSGEAPSSLFIDTPWFASETSVCQEISGLVSGTVYIIECVVTTRLGDTLSLWSYIRSETVGG